MSRSPSEKILHTSIAHGGVTAASTLTVEVACMESETQHHQERRDSKARRRLCHVNAVSRVEWWVVGSRRSEKEGREVEGIVLRA